MNNLGIPAIDVQHLKKTYIVPERGSGFRAAVQSVIQRRSRHIQAVSDLSFQVEPGEIVGFLGPNGAGKTTTLKMLSGLLHPTEGQIQILGHTPAKRNPRFLEQMTLVMGQRNQLLWDLPVADSFERNRAIYGIASERYRAIREELVELLDLGDLLRKPVRNLSLGERMKCELAAALLHQPKVLFLDEPTIGLDITMQRRLRTFIAEYNRRYEATVILTSHYMADVASLCQRVIIIHQGRLFFDGLLGDLVQHYAPHKTITIEFEAEPTDLTSYGQVISLEGNRATLRAPKTDITRITNRLLTDLHLADLTVADPPIDDVIEHIFSTEGSKLGEA